MEVREASAAYLVTATPQVPKGYKQTEVGVIPEDWSEVALITLAGGAKERFDDGDWIEARFLAESGIRLIQTGNIGVGVFIEKETKKYISPRSFELLRCKALKEGDLLICRLAEPAGRACLFPKIEDDKAITAVDVTIFRPIEELADRRYLLQVFGTRSWFTAISGRCGGSTRTRIARGALGQIHIPLPPTKAEQEAIAEALSDADALIESLEQFLAKKRHLKQGAMQQLLTGKKRLPGFSGGWEVKRLGEIAEIVMGQSPSSAHYNNKGDGLPLIQGNADISNRKTIKRVFTTELTKRGRCGDILMSVRAPVGEISRAAFNVCLGRGVCAIRYPNEFLYHVLVAKEPMWAKLSKGSTFDSVNSTDVKAFGIELPKDDDEQTAIATLLSDMDTQLAALEEKLTKARAIKQGMMQELLTGRIRLI